MDQNKLADGLQSLFKDLKGAIGDLWEEKLLINAERVSKPLALRMLSQIGLDAETTTPFQHLDNGCGVGVVAAELQRLIKPEVLRQSSTLCGDFSAPVVELVNKRIKEEGWVNVEARQVDAQKTDLETASFTHVTVNIGFHVIPDSEAALNEAIRILKPGGHLGFTTWTLVPGWAADFREAFASFPFEAPFVTALQTSKWGDWANVNWVRKTLEGRGLQDVNVNVLATLSHTDSPAHFVAEMKLMVNWIVTSCWTDEQQKAHSVDELLELSRQFFEKKYEGRGWDITWVSIIASGRVGLSS